MADEKPEIVTNEDWHGIPLSTEKDWKRADEMVTAVERAKMLCYNPDGEGRRAYAYPDVDGIAGQIEAAEQAATKRTLATLTSGDAKQRALHLVHQWYEQDPDAPVNEQGVDGLASMIAKRIYWAEQAARDAEREACAVLCDAQAKLYDECCAVADWRETGFYEEKAAVCANLARDLRARAKETSSAETQDSTDT